MMFFLRGKRRGRSGAIAFDSFNRADSAVAIGTSDSGHTWGLTGGTWGISSNQLYNPVVATAFDCAYLDIGLSDAIVRGSLSASGGLAVRILNNANYLRVQATAATNFTVVSRVGGVDATLATIAQVPVSGDLVEMRLRGQIVDVWINGAFKVSVADPAYASLRTRHGFRSVNAAQRYDNFKIIGW